MPTKPPPKKRPWSYSDGTHAKKEAAHLRSEERKAAAFAAKYDGTLHIRQVTKERKTNGIPKNTKSISKYLQFVRYKDWYDLMSVRDLAKMVGCTPETVKKWIEDGELPVVAILRDPRQLKSRRKTMFFRLKNAVAVATKHFYPVPIGAIFDDD